MKAKINKPVIMLEKTTHLTWKYLMMRQLQLFVVLDLMASCFCSKQNYVELWLEDYTRKKATYSDIQSDSPYSTIDQELPDYSCPTFPKGRSASTALFCLLPACETDQDCDSPIQKCCHNGCLYTCTKGLAPPPIIDWKWEPERDPRTGISWLIKDEEDAPDDDEEHIAEEAGRMEEMSKSRLVAMCELDNTIYIDGSKFTHNGYQCKCNKGLVICDVREKRK